MFRFYSKDNGPRVTIVGECSNDVLKIAAARCSRKDNFVRAKGRELAEKRLAEGKIFLSVPMKACDVQYFLLLAKSAVSVIQKKPDFLNPKIHEPVNK
jgi:hypothetical protein